MGRDLNSDTIADLRHAIDIVDTKLFKLLEHRFDLATRIAPLKVDPQAIEDVDRNREIFDRIAALATRTGIDSVDAVEIWRAILRASLSCQRNFLARSKSGSNE